MNGVCKKGREEKIKKADSIKNKLSKEKTKWLENENKIKKKKRRRYAPQVVGDEEIQR